MPQTQHSTRGSGAEQLGGSASQTMRAARNVLLIVIVALLLRIMLVAMLPMQALTQMVHDDALFIHLASSIVHGQWLGNYNQTTLIKGVGYPLFIAATSIIHLPLKFAEHLVYSIACLAMFIALRPAMSGSRGRLIVFLILLFNPMMLDSSMNRGLREGIYSAQTLLVIACAVGASLRWQSQARRQVIWFAALGASFAWFWITREEGAWVVPSVVLLLLAGGIAAWRGGRGISWIALCCVPPLIAVATVNVVCFFNWRHYGIWETIELKSPELQEAYGAICRVKPDHFDPWVPVSRAMREKIYPQSPAFAELRPTFEGLPGRVWAALGATDLPNLNGEIAGGWFIFALRDAVAAAGHAHSAAESRDFYARLASEINAACDRGALSALPPRASLAPPWNSQYVPLLEHVAVHGVMAVASFEAIDIDVGPSTGDAAALAEFRELTHTSATPLDSGNSGPQAAVDDSRSIVAWQFIAVVYQFVLPWVSGAAMLIFAAQAVLLLKGYRSPLLIIELATIGLIAARVIIVAYLDVAFFPAINTRYLAPAYPMILLFDAIAIVEGVRIVLAMRGARGTVSKDDLNPA